ncbi:unnamed protein product, partial [marine sediment metagenome]
GYVSPDVAKTIKLWQNTVSPTAAVKLLNP